MKNIHILPTDKPSRLVKQKYDSIDRLCLADMATKRVEYKRFNLYITSDEEIKEGDSIYDASEMSVVKFTQTFSRPNYFTQFCKKVILTTDQDLIKDGIQAIDDKFLEWLVKNPSCEKVEVEPLMAGFIDDEPSYYENMYEIIIPKEEPKQIKCYCGHTTTCDCEPLEKPKQEKLEEVAERLYPTDCSNWSIKVPLDERKSFIEGAKWQQENSNINALDFEIDALKREIKVLKHQQERSYSEEEVLDITKQAYSMGRSNYTIKAFNEWFEQFKKK